MTEREQIRWCEALLCLAIWNPDLMNFIPEGKRKRGMRMSYRTRGIVMHDRALNGEALLGRDGGAEQALSEVARLTEEIGQEL